MRTSVLALAVMGITMTTGQPAEAGDAARTAILKAARGPAETDLGRPIRFAVDRLNREGEWAFLVATMQDPYGRPVNFEGTPLAEAAANGAVSHRYVALLKSNGRSWTVIAHLVGPTDMGWNNWASEFGAPPALIIR